MIFLFHRLSFLQSLLDPESQKHDWLELALTHDAPQRCGTMTTEGKPRSAFGLRTIGGNFAVVLIESV